MTSPMAVDDSLRAVTSVVISEARATASRATLVASWLAARRREIESNSCRAFSAADSPARTMSRRCETSCCTLRSADARDSLSSTYSLVKKSIVPTTRSPLSTGKQMPDRTPARCAAGARTQSVSSARSRTKTRSRVRHARPDSPTPSAKVASRVTLRNSSPAEPDSVWNRSSRPLGSTSQ